MDLQKCRTCFIELECNDLYLKLNTVNKHSKLSLGEKLKICVPILDLSNGDTQQICMQCSMHLETAYAFHVTCLDTEEQFQKYITRCNEEKTKKILSCSTCNINFSSKNIFDLHMKVLHTKVEVKEEKPPIVKEEEKLDKIYKKEKEKPFLQMVFVQTTSINDKTDKQTERHRKRGYKRRLSEEQLKEYSERAKRQKRDDQGRFLTREKLRQLAATSRSTKMNDKNVEVKKDLVKMTNKIGELKKSLPKPIDKVTEVSKPSPKPINNSNRTKMNLGLHNCKYCDRKFNLYGNLMRHISCAHSNKCKKCPICNKYYLNAKKHAQMYKCVIPKVAKTPNPEVPTPQKTPNPEVPKPPNREVPKPAKTPNAEVSKPPKTRIPEAPKPAKKTVKYKFSLDKTFCYIEQGNRFRCMLCDKVYRWIKDARSHLKNKHDTPQKCKMCKGKYSSLEYTVHIGEGCTGPRDICNYTTDGECICPFCNKIFAERKHLHGHFTKHTNLPLNCKTCNTKFVRLVGYAEHLVKGCAKIAKPDDNNTLFVDVLTTDSNAQESAYKDPLEENHAIKEKDTNISEEEIETNEELHVEETIETSMELEEEEEENEIEQKGSFLEYTGDITDDTAYESFTTESTTYTDCDNENMTAVDRDKIVKVEPTELLDNNTYLQIETNDYNNGLFNNLDNLDRQLESNSNESTVIDAPDLIFVLNNF